MSFRKRNIDLPPPGSSSSTVIDTGKNSVPGIRPSPLDGRLTISTGTRSLDSLLAGHAGLPLGTSILIEESGATDFGGVLLRYFAAEGLLQGHCVHVLGPDDKWGRELPGVADVTGGPLFRGDEVGVAGDRMKIAWRYERLGEFGRDRSSLKPSSADTVNSATRSVFCHDFDLTKRLPASSLSLLKFVKHNSQTTADFSQSEASRTLFTRFIQHLASQLLLNPPSMIHRVIIPGLLSPAIYPNTAPAPENVLQFIHSIRALLRKYPKQLTAAITLPVSLFPRTTGLTRWLEILSDGVIELAPFPSRPHSATNNASTLAASQDEFPQGMLQVHRLPILHERGGGGVNLTNLAYDLTFILSRRKGLEIKPFNLPPVNGSSDEQHAETGDHGNRTRVNTEF